MTAIAGKKVVVVGMGRTALSLVNLLLREDATPFVTDTADAASLSPFCEQLDRLGVEYECGGHTTEAFEGATLVIPSPGVSPAIEPIRQAAAAGVTVLGEMEFASRYCTSKILAVTGTNGKTTTTELLRSILEGARKSVALAGNNDVPLSQAVMSSEQAEYFVLEVSSYQLEGAQSFRPWIGALLNVTPDHLARHTDLTTYASIKARLFENQVRGDHAVLNYDDSVARETAPPDAVQRIYFSLESRLDGSESSLPVGMWIDGESVMFGDLDVCSTSDISLPGHHNRQNALAALCMARAADLEWPDVLDALRAFKGVEHRIERVATLDNITYYNDSKSTNIDSLRVALESFSEPNSVVLIAGGRGKGDDYGVLERLVSDRVSKMIVIGEDAPILRRAFEGGTAVLDAADLPAAVRLSSEVASAGQVVLLSPGCASFDMFDSFEHRGRVYKDAVMKLSENLPSNCGA